MDTMGAASKIQAPDSVELFDRLGFHIALPVISPENCDLQAGELDALLGSHRTKFKSKIAGVRNLFARSPSVRKLAAAPSMLHLLRELAGLDFFSVRAIYFDKNPQANWLVPWHQDPVVAVEERIETCGFTGWSEKDGVHHVHPPAGILEKMVVLRLHLDDCGAENGALKVIPGSHRKGILKAEDILCHATQEAAVVCEVAKGGILVMRPLLLHASMPFKNQVHRRVWHVEYACIDLPNGLRWFESQ